jgi:hypothetical protein
MLVAAFKNSPAGFSELLDGMIAEQDDELTG